MTTLERDRLSFAACTEKAAAVGRAVPRRRADRGALGVVSLMVKPLDKSAVAREASGRCRWLAALGWSGYNISPTL